MKLENIRVYDMEDCKTRHYSGQTADRVIFGWFSVYGMGSDGA